MANWIAILYRIQPAWNFSCYALSEPPVSCWTNVKQNRLKTFRFCISKKLSRFCWISIFFPISAYNKLTEFEKQRKPELAWNKFDSTKFSLNSLSPHSSFCRHWRETHKDENKIISSRSEKKWKRKSENIQQFEHTAPSSTSGKDGKVLFMTWNI